MIPREPYAKCLEYIEKQWDVLTHTFLHDQKVQVGLPHPFISPNNDIYQNDQFYWDSYFIILGLVADGRTELAKGMVDNFVYLFRRFGMVPTRNRFFDTGVSQPPFLTSMIEEVYRVTRDAHWRKGAMAAAGEELQTYWMDTKRAERHLVHKNLSRYADHYILHKTAEQESGWDTTSRFSDLTLDILPIDLNVCLYKYEKDLAHFYMDAGNAARASEYEKQAEERKKNMEEFMWNEAKGFFFDYNYQKGGQSAFYSVAGFYPLWAKMASPEQAEHVCARLPLFEYEGGLANTQAEGLSQPFRQHDYPNGWAPQQWIVVKGLLNYGFTEDAERIARKWLDCNKKVFEETGVLWEKYDVVQCAIGKPDRYPTQSGFGWTNAIFVRLLQEFSPQEERRRASKRKRDMLTAIPKHTLSLWEGAHHKREAKEENTL